MNENENLVPKRRFKEFKNTGTWEQRKFSTIVNRVSQQSNDSNLPKVEFEDIVSGEGRLNKDISRKFDSRKGTVFEPEFILYGKLRPYLKNWLFPNFKGIALGDFWVFEPNNSSSIFDYYLIQSDKYQTVANLSSGTKMPRSDWKTVSETVFSIPDSINEQEKIGKFFNQLDNTIALHQRKLEKSKALKSAYLSEMFPAEGERKPKRRFAGFTDDWEQRKLIDVAEMFDNLRIPVTASDRVEGNTAYYGANGIQDYVDGFTHDGEFVLIAEDGANDLINYPVNYVKGKIWVNNHAHVVSGKKSELDNLFLTARIKSMNISHWLVGGGRAKLNGDVLKKIPLTLPIYEEQKKIGAFFKQLDDAIALHQHKLEKLQNIKQAYLNELFV